MNCWVYGVLCRGWVLGSSVCMCGLVCRVWMFVVLLVLNLCSSSWLLWCEKVVCVMCLVFGKVVC